MSGPIQTSDVTLVTRVRSFIAARFARGEYLGLHLTVGFLITVGALLLFGSITRQVVDDRSITAFDLTVHTWMRAHATPLGDRVALTISFIGGPITMTILALVVAMIAARMGAWLTLWVWLAAFIVGALLDWMLKNIIRRPRPIGAERFLHGVTFSYPSGHSMGSLIGLSMLAYVLIKLWPPARAHRVTVVAVAVILVLLVGWSRLYLGVHYLSDVIAGFAVGIVWVTVCMTGMELATRPRERAAA
ncbi:MAG TPA: phosphatase PAP2 family protein [Gemmatimonadaceae bacterium]|nr:phosphatase PAP2 family protein [Gemmatimonadaceae bacterium]